jgi:hypothetical protein
VKIHALASLPHYKEHVEAIWKHLPDELRGEPRFGAGTTSRGWHGTDDIVMVGGFYDIDRVPANRIIYVEHGAGQSYNGDARAREHPAYHGTPHHPNRVIAYISPRQEVADSWDKPAYAAGAPVCDPYVKGECVQLPDVPVAAITFHWDARRICPEAGSALEHYVEHLGDLYDELENQGFIVIAHHHPRDVRLAAMWRHVRVKNPPIEVVPVADVRKFANLLICDNSSLMYEMSYLGRNVVALNAPWYRRDVEHGLRFWQWRGIQVDTPEELLALDFTDRSEQFPESNSRDAYDHPWANGSDGPRAADWLTSLVATL